MEFADLERSSALFQDAFGVDLRPGDNQVDDRWTGGRHSKISWPDGAYLRFALDRAKATPTCGAAITFSVDDLDDAQARAAGAGPAVLHAPRAEPWGAAADTKISTGT